ncbi:unnamed protein product [Nippostrongylus brasiliensis]|uniref:Uncharacterized protein n=1 Tax=Nippostrongylus brasiliensis TaxID=27835 RepID=A0A0N4Y4Q5_NIPBR|nr:unnamed protein product [Nippostrongylus brasiliensis]
MMQPDSTYGVYCDEENKIHYYNCAPIKEKPRKLKPLPNPVKKLFTKIFQRQDSTDAQSHTRTFFMAKELKVLLRTKKCFRLRIIE